MGILPVQSTLLAWLLWIQASPVTLSPVVTLPTDGAVVGSIADLDMLPNGNVLVLDRQAHQILEFDQSGALVRTISRDGQGPGEIRAAIELEVTKTGEIWVVDWGNNRIARWDPDGNHVGSRLLGEVIGQAVVLPQEFVINESGVYLKTAGFMPDQPAHVFRLHEDLRGVADTLAVLVPAPGAPICQVCPISVSPSGRVYGPQGDTVFAVSEVGPSGEQVLVLRRDGVPAVLRSDDESARYRAAVGRLLIPEGVKISEPPLSPYQLRFGRLAIGFDDHSRTWLAPTVPEEEPTVFYLFDSSGRYLTSVKAEVHLTGFKIRGRHLLAIAETPIGEPIVRVYEIQ